MSQKFSWVARLAGVVSVVGLLAVAGVAYAVVPTLSQTSITVGLGQSLTLSSQNNISVYMGSNSSANVASVSINGTQITVTGIAPGTANVSICAVGTSSDCTTLYVTSQVGAVTTTSSTTTTASTTSGLSFSQNNLSLMAGGSQVVTVSGGNSSYTITGNSNPGVGSPSMSNGNSIDIYAAAAGSDAIKICDTSNLCGVISVTVTASTASSANQAVTFSIPNPTLAAGQTLNVALSGPGATGFVVLSNTNASVAQATVNSGVTLAITGESAGTDTLAVCATGGGCTSLSVTVTGGTSANAATTPTTSSVTSPVTTSTVVPTTISPTSGTIVPNATLLGEIQSLQSVVTQALAQMQLIQTQLNLLVAQVNAGAGGTAVAGTTGTGTGASSGGTFTELLTIGSTGAQVTALQNQLISLGFFSGSATGFYGSLTQEAVMKYQTAHGITATGYVGPSTRAALNAGN